MSTRTFVISPLGVLLGAAACAGSGPVENDRPTRTDLDVSEPAPPPAPPEDHAEGGGGEEVDRGTGAAATCAFRDGPSVATAFGPGWSALPKSSSVGIAGRLRHSAVWTGQEMIVFGGGALSDGGVVAAADGAVLRLAGAKPHWKKLPEWPLEGGRIGHTATWTGRHMIVWGGSDALRGSILPRHTAARNDGALFDPCTGVWAKIEGSPLSPRYGATAVWAESTHELIVAGGNGVDEAGLGIVLRDAAAYDPTTGIWRKLPDAPLAPNGHGVWDGTRVEIVSSPSVLVFDPRKNQWDTVRTRIEPSTQLFEVFATGALGSSLLVGEMSGMEIATCEDDAIHVLHFAGTSTGIGARTLAHPSREILSQQPRSAAATWYANGKLFTFGGRGCGPAGYLGDGAVLDVASDTWSAMPAWDLPYEGARDAATVVWTGHSAVIYGGFRYAPGPGLLDDASVFTP